MDYKEKYEMALEGIQEILSSGEDSIKMSRLQLRLQSIFPELKKSEDEDIAVLDALIRRLEGEDVYVSPHLAAECLKSLKDRVQPTAKARVEC